MLGLAAKIILNKCLKASNKDKIMVITDSKLEKIGRGIYLAAKETAESKLVKIKIPKTHGTEPDRGVAKEMLKYDVILMPTTKSLSHTKARKNASKKGARIASMPGFTKEMAPALDVDYGKIDSINKNLIKKLSKAKKLRIIAKGTDIVFSFGRRKWFNDNGILSKKGSFGNLPAGEVCAAPLENKTNGKFTVNASVGGFGVVDAPIEVVVKNGCAVKISGGRTAAKLKKLLKNKKYRNIAELGIGTNCKAKVRGNVLEDEKVYGTAHIALGNNISFGGKVSVPFHADCVISKPTIFCDGKMIMEKGSFVKKTVCFGRFFQNSIEKFIYNYRCTYIQLWLKCCQKTIKH